MSDKDQIATRDTLVRQIMFSTVKEKGTMIGIIISFISAPLLSWWFLIVTVVLSFYLLWHGFNEWKERSEVIDAKFSEFVKELWYDRQIIDFIPNEISQDERKAAYKLHKKQDRESLLEEPTFTEKEKLPQLSEEETQSTIILEPLLKNEPKTLHNFFKTDFNTMLCVGNTHNITITDKATKLITTVDIESQLVADFFAKCQFITFYIPPTSETFEICKYLVARHVMAFISEDEYRIEGGFRNERPIALKELQFTGRIYIYYQGYLTTEESEYLIELYKKENLSLILRSQGYAFDRNYLSYNFPQIKS